jgi:hypothetical protein
LFNPTNAIISFNYIFSNHNDKTQYKYSVFDVVILMMLIINGVIFDKNSNIMVPEIENNIIIKSKIANMFKNFVITTNNEFKIINDIIQILHDKYGKYLCLLDIISDDDTNRIDTDVNASKNNNNTLTAPSLLLSGNKPPMEKDLITNKLKPSEIYITTDIINTMSYSKVKKNGFPNLDNYQWAYHIVRESDLLSAYKFERALMYHMCVNKESIDNALINAKDIFNYRVLAHNDDNLFFTEYGQKESLKLHDQSIVDMYQWNKIINKTIN